jgi:Xaa-Pro aminopeptidase
MIDWKRRIKDVQTQLSQQGLDGWLLYDFQQLNPLARQFLDIAQDSHITRRIFYWIPQQGEPVKLVHGIESHLLPYLPGKVSTYTSRESLCSALRSLVKGKVAMEYSPRQENPYLSKVDAGLVELISSFGAEVVSSGELLQRYTSILTEKQLKSHLDAAQFLDQLAEATWRKIGLCLRNKESINEHQVQQWMLEQMQQAGFVTHGQPICAVNAHAANPHFEPDPHASAPIRPGDLILIDLWCKKAVQDSVYADITRVAVAASVATPRHQEIFSIVRLAQKKATEFVLQRHQGGRPALGYEADEVCRSVIEAAGFGTYFTHRTGHNIYTEAHGPGAHLDSLETKDSRPLIAGTCFSIEPGIYLPGEFGIRLEYDLYLAEGGQGMISGGVQEQLRCIE